MKLMIYNLLKSYREYLLEFYSHETARTYRNRLCILFQGQNITDTINKLDVQMILGKMAMIKYKNTFAQFKNAFLRFCEFKNIDLSAETLANIEQLEKGTIKKYRKIETIDYKLIDKKIKHLKNAKLKLCYQIILATGLRVSEIAGIFAKDCEITDNDITFNFIGKGGKKESVMIKSAEYDILYRQIIENTPLDKKSFYSAINLQTKANELGFKCHDLRRIYAKSEHKKCGSKIELMTKMRHFSIKKTNIYLRSKIIGADCEII